MFIEDGIERKTKEVQGQSLNWILKQTIITLGGEKTY